MGRRERREAVDRLAAIRADQQAGHVLLEGALRAGSLDEVRALFDDDAPFPNVEDPLIPVSLLVRAIDVAPVETVRVLLARGADPNGKAGDFPALYAAVTSDRSDRDELIGVLLEAGADPNQRGLNDYTVLHHAAEIGDRAMVNHLIAAGADPTQRTRVDDYETPSEVARSAGHVQLAAQLDVAAAAWGVEEGLGEAPE